MRPTPEGGSNKKGATHRWYHRRGGGCRPFILLQNPDHLDRVAALPASVRITGSHARCGLRQQQPAAGDLAARGLPGHPPPAERPLQRGRCARPDSGAVETDGGAAVRWPGSGPRSSVGSGRALTCGARSAAARAWACAAASAGLFSSTSAASTRSSSCGMLASSLSAGREAVVSRGSTWCSS